MECISSEDDPNIVAANDGKISEGEGNAEQAVNNTVYVPDYCIASPWTLVCSAVKEFATSKTQGFLKGCKWSPDGTCLMACAEDNVLRLFDLPADLYNSYQKSYKGCTTTEISPSLRIKEGGLIYDYCWHPHMSSWNPETCLLASSAKEGPVHLWDAYKGELAASYRAYNNVDEVEAAKSICISPDGEKLYCGFDKCVRVFDVHVPGRSCQTRPTKLKDGTPGSQTGIISCIAVNPALPSVYAAGSYMKTIGPFRLPNYLTLFNLIAYRFQIAGLYSEPDGAALCVLEGHRGGVTHLKFSPDGLVLYSGGRKDREILCWDLRNPGRVLFTVNRTVETNQRIYFDLDPSGRYLITGDTNGFVTIWDTQRVMEISAGSTSESAPASTTSEMIRWRVHNDCTNGVSFHPWLPLVATSSGQRHLLITDNSSGDSSESDDGDCSARSVRENCVKLWWTGEIDGDGPIINDNPAVPEKAGRPNLQQFPLVDRTNI
nr:EOG090X06W9 [Ilyocryptus agilis]